MDWKTLFLTPEGRIGRRDFWIGFVIILVASVVLGVIPVLGQLIGIALLWPQICIHAKRLHDMGKTAWLMVVPFAVSFIAVGGAVIVGGAGVISAGAMGDNPAAVGAALAGMGAAMGFLGIALLVGLAFLLWVGLSRGEVGPNRFGPPPVSLTGGSSPSATVS